MDQRLKRHRAPCRKRITTPPGFTLVELMIVVTILGVLATLAVPGYRNYILRARASEGVTFLGTIAVRQEAFYAEFGHYLDVASANGAAVSYPAGGDWTSSASSFTPNATTIKGQPVQWPSPPPAGWAQLGANPGGAVRMGYISIAGAPGTEPEYLNMDSDYWFVAAALADLDGDGTYMTMEITSQSSRVWQSEVSHE